jgi:hypothetical protein
MSKYQVERPRNLAEIQRIDEQTRVSDLPAAAAAHEAPKLLFMCPSLPRRLLLEGAEGSKVTPGVNDLFHRGGTESADQLVLQVCDAHVETQPFHINAGEVGAEASPLETAPELALLCGVTETRQPRVRPLRAEPLQEAPYGLRTPNWHNGNALGAKTPTAAPSERLKRNLVADPFNEHDRTRVDTCGRRVRCANKWSTPTAHRSFDICKVRSLLLVHIPYLHSSRAARPRPIRAPTGKPVPASRPGRPQPPGQRVRTPATDDFRRGRRSEL